jgi:hypothetical protein
MAEMMALIPRPIAENIEPWIKFQGQKLEAKLRLLIPLFCWGDVFITEEGTKRQIYIVPEKQ